MIERSRWDLLHISADGSEFGAASRAASTTPRMSGSLGAATDDIAHVGATARAASEAAMVTEFHLSNCTLLRAARCAPHPSGDIGRSPTGLR